MENLSYRRNQLATLKEQAAYNERFKLVITHIHAAKDVDQILVTLHDDILSLFDAERLALYAVDAERKEVYSRFSPCGFANSACLLATPCQSARNTIFSRLSDSLHFSHFHTGTPRIFTTGTICDYSFYSYEVDATIR